MPFRAPRYMHIHAARQRGVGNISLDGDPADPLFPIDNLVDDRQGTIFKTDGATVGLNIDIDLGASFAADGLSGLSRLIIAPNHNIDSITVIDDDAADFVGANTLHASDTSPSPGVLIDIDPFDTSNSTQRFIRIQVGSGTKQYFLPQLFLTKTVTLNVGPNLRRSQDEPRGNFARQLQNTGLSPTVQLGPTQREIEYAYEAPIVGADLTALEALIDAVGMSRPFYVDPASFSTPPETDEPVLFMKFDTFPRVRYSVEVPQTGARSKVFDLRLVEALD